MSEHDAITLMQNFRNCGYPTVLGARKVFHTYYAILSIMSTGARSVSARFVYIRTMKVFVYQITMLCIISDLIG